MSASMQHVQEDVRTRLIQQKHYRAALPQPLEDWLWSQDLSATAERVFRIHWGEGFRQVCKGGTYVTQLSETFIASRLNVSERTVQRAYSELKRLKLVVRIEPARGSNPFQRPVTKTEVRIPRDILNQMLSSPDRRKGDLSDVLPRASDFKEKISADPSAQEVAEVNEAPVPDWKACRETLRSAMSEAEFNQNLLVTSAKAGPGTLRLFAPNRYVLDAIRAKYLDLIRASLHSTHDPAIEVSICIGSADDVANQEGISPARTAQAPRISLLVARRVRERICEVAPQNETDRLLQEVLWSVKAGSFAKEPIVAKAINACLKLIQAGRWRRPKGMPSNWEFEIVIRGEKGRA